jgi:hypothetical protein
VRKGLNAVNSLCAACAVELSAGILEQSMRDRNPVGIGLSLRHARVHGRAGRYDNSVPTQLLALIDCSIILAQIIFDDPTVSTPVCTSNHPIKVFLAYAVF